MSASLKHILIADIGTSAFFLLSTLQVEKKKKKCFKKFNIKVLADTVRTHYYSILNRTVVPFLFYSLPSVRALLRPGEPLLNVLILPF